MNKCILCTQVPVFLCLVTFISFVQGSRSPEAIKKQFVDLLFKQSFKLLPVQDLR